MYNDPPRALLTCRSLLGDEALERNKTYSLFYPVRHGQIDNWTHMEYFWEHCIFKYLRSEPEDHYFLLVRLRSARFAVANRLTAD